MNGIPLRIFPATLLLLMALTGFAQQDKMPVLRFQYGQLVGELPYGQSFFIKGENREAISGQRYDIIELRMYQEGIKSMRKSNKRKAKLSQDAEWRKERWDQSTVYTTVWLNQPDRERDTFKLFVASRLMFSTDYKFDFSFYKKYRVGDAETQNIVKEVKRRLLDFQNKEATSAGQAVPIRIAKVNEILTSVIKEYQKEIGFGYLDLSGGHAMLSQEGPDSFQIPLQSDDPQFDVALAIGNVVRDEGSLRNRQLAMDRIQTEVRNYGASEEYQSLRKDLESGGVADHALDYAGDYFADVRALEGFVLKLRLARNPIKRLLTHYYKLKGNDSANAPTRTTAERIYTALLEVNRLANDHATRSQEVQQVEGRLELFNAQLGPKDLDMLIAEGFVLANTASVISQPGMQPSELASGFDESGGVMLYSAGGSTGTDLKSVRIGTVFGAGIAGMNFVIGEDAFKNTEPAFFTYIGAKIYFRPVDKRMAGWQKYPGSRWSLVFGGVVAGDVAFKGRNMAKPVGFFPVGGISYDFNRYLGIDAGFIIFNETSLSTLSTATRLRAAPFITLSADLNLVNGIGNLLQGEGKNPFK